MWHNQYIGIPFVEKGADRHGVNCWGLVVLVYREQLGLAVHDYSEDIISTRDTARVRALVEAEARQWVEVDQAEPFDVLEFLIAGRDWGVHVGIAIDDRQMLHAGAGGKDVCIEDFTGPKWRNKLKAIWRRCR